MKNRIRKKVELIRQCGASLSDNLSDLDLKIHEMSPTVGSSIQHDVGDPTKYDKSMVENDDNFSSNLVMDEMADLEDYYEEVIIDESGYPEELTTTDTIEDTMHPSYDKNLQVNDSADAQSPSSLYDEEDRMLQDIVHEIWDEDDNVMNGTVANERTGSPSASTHQNNKSVSLAEKIRGRALDTTVASSNRCNDYRISSQLLVRYSIQDNDEFDSDTYVNDTSIVHGNNNRIGDKLLKAAQKKASTATSLQPNNLDSAKVKCLT